MDEKELTEVPLSNREVLKVLKARDNTNEHPRTTEMIKYLEIIETGPYQYPLEILRDLKTNKGLEADLNMLTVVSNISDLSILSPSDRKIIAKLKQSQQRN